MGVRGWVLGMAACVLLMICAGCNGPSRETKSEGKLLVVASIAPMADFARRVGGDRAEVEQLVPTGASPHTFEPNPRQMMSLAKADVFVLNGHGLEFWADKAISAAGNPKLRVVDTSAGIQDAVQDELEHPGETDGHHAHPQGNPHFWLDPMLAIKQVDAITAAYCGADPKGKAVYESNAKAFKAEITQLDATIRASVAKFQSKDFVAQHPAWIYFARRYGLRQVAVIEESPGKEPTTAYLRKMVDAVRKSKARAIFAEPQLSAKAAEIIGAETGTKVLLLDPLGAPPHEDYISNMLYNVGVMGEGL